MAWPADMIIPLYYYIIYYNSVYKLHIYKLYIYNITNIISSWHQTSKSAIRKNLVFFSAYFRIIRYNVYYACSFFPAYILYSITTISLPFFACSISKFNTKSILLLLVLNDLKLILVRSPFLSPFLF